ncbi:hypothetical protein GFL38_30410 [Rhizobium leguminosarum bv. viciae]|uniref:hypothetical protein n=1 Tax=Rhizobium ruizarguesonis TaxID=2081791 RepID=UPI0010326E47|nr:hypothetical protein [Rhizobium ruizarguesonis]NKJ76510.1 hypothetical protein [Rhizobium leguminosarum bv. viciae]NEJ16253.1 hypothetical protein [Rhizobium ruizarguesonis]NEK30174.1 hypothetical protein [Rhizobium ruizarguesonis]NKQ81464.1 hypothetical protein [Rhizobium ruizarguesonis]TAZ93799.1 hypothetical protein ELH67_04155 [Rhizobium ruizarguesonis]
MGKLWQRITYYRHRSELWALALAKWAPCLAMLPIGFIVCFWWVVAPSLIVFPIVRLLENLGKLGELMLALFSIPALVVLGFALPWFSGWYDIAVGLMLGRFTAASAKEKALTESIHAYRTRAI